MVVPSHDTEIDLIGRYAIQLLVYTSMLADKV